MASVNASALNVLTKEQAEEARRIIDEIGFVSNDLAGVHIELATRLDRVRVELKKLFSEINDDRYPVVQ
ncbi:hypothetical protein [Azonexus hydrophilus]|uniref:Uncharacterized protein n=1 Tax=Azonexus hydrophilus TaxID=418702 RepID=A0ABZ2XLV0_9RHOO